MTFDKEMDLQRKIMKLLIAEHEARPGLEEKRKTNDVLKPMDKYDREAVMLGLKKLNRKRWMNAHHNANGDVIYYPSEEGIEALKSPWDIDRRIKVFGIISALLGTAYLIYETYTQN